MAGGKKRGRFLQPNDYPPLYIASDQSAVRLEHNYFRLLKTELILFLAASLVSILTAFSGIGFHRPLAIIAAILVSAAFVVLWCMRTLRLERKWFQYRAVTESLKTATWRYMMQAPPFDSAGDKEDIDQEFMTTVRAIQLDRLPAEAQRHEAQGWQITEFMSTVRKLSLEQKRDRYLHDRLDDQERWYKGKSAANRQSSNRWSSIVLATQGLAIALAVLRVGYPEMPLSTVSFLMTGASSMLAWTQARRHEDLAEPYAVAAQELKELRALSGSVKDLESLHRFVSDVEETISREHTKWLARRSIENVKGTTSGTRPNETSR